MNKREKIIDEVFTSWLKKDIEAFLKHFSQEVLYIESWGPAYNNKEQIKSWFTDWNKNSTVLEWNIKEFFHIGEVCLCEWYFKCESNGDIIDFDGVSVVKFDENDAIVYLKEYQSKVPNYYPYE